MGKVILSVSLSLDGFSAGPDTSMEHPLGIGGERLHEWMSGGEHGPASDIDQQIAAELFASADAVITGWRTFEVGLPHWGDDGAFGMPCFVLTHRSQPVLVKGPTTFTFVTDGVVSALNQANAAANDKDIFLMGAANVAQQFLRAGLVDEIRIQLVPVLLGEGARLLDAPGAGPIQLKQTRIVESPNVTHLWFKVVK